MKSQGGLSRQWIDCDCKGTKSSFLNGNDGGHEDVAESAELSNHGEGRRAFRIEWSGRTRGWLAINQEVMKSSFVLALKV